MGPSYVQKSDFQERAKVRDAFEIKEGYGLLHEPGLVVVLDRVVTRDPAALVGRTATIVAPGAGPIARRIDGAKDHLAATSLFFKDMVASQVPVGSGVTIDNGGSAT